MLSRREFLIGGALGVAALGSLSTRLLAGDQPAGPGVAKVIVIGAGLAGLAAAYELNRSGYEVAVLEASSRPGGRVYTVRDKFTDGLYVEAGAMATNDKCAFMSAYIKRFGLKMTPVHILANSVYLLHGHRLVLGQDAPFSSLLAGAVQSVQSVGRDYLFAPVKELGDPNGWPEDTVRMYDGMSYSQFLESRGTPESVIEYLRISPINSLGEGIDKTSAVQVLRNLAVNRSVSQEYVFDGGTDLLTDAFVRALPKMITYNAPVVKIDRQDQDRVTLTCKPQTGPAFQVSADFVISAVPFSVLRDIERSPRFSPEKEEAIEKLSYTSATRTFLQCKRQFWRDDGLTGWAETDLPVGRILTHPFGFKGTKGILESFSTGPAARMFGAMPQGKRIEETKTCMLQVYPRLPRYYERGWSICWDAEPWARGTFAWYRPGEFQKYFRASRNPEGRVLFAGEHTSMFFGMEAAVESGNRVAYEIQDVAGLPARLPTGRS